MALRCLLFCSDEGTAQLLLRTLADLGSEAEHCPAPEAVERITTELFQLLIVDWDDQPEAASLLNAARERKAAERPLALAIVGDDASVSQALQAGANSILRKPVQANQAKDTLTTAQGMLRARQEAMLAQATAAAAGGPNVASPTDSAAPEQTTLRAGEFLQSGMTPSTQYVTESEVPKTVNQVTSAEADPVKELAPTAASVEAGGGVPESPEAPDEPRGLDWYLKASRQAASTPAEAPAKTDLLSFAETPSHSQISEKAGAPEAVSAEQEKRDEAALFAYIADGSREEKKSKPQRRLSKFAMGGILAAALAIAYFAVPQSLWRPKVQALFARAFRAGHNWLNPQPVTTPSAPASHENFGRADDEYKLPVAEAIPDATTDPSQIRVVPVIDPTAKQPNGANNAAGQTAPNTAAKDTPDSSQPDNTQAQSPEIPIPQVLQPVPVTPQLGSQPEGGIVQAPVQSVPAQTQPAVPPPAASTPIVAVSSPPPRITQPRSTPAAPSNAIPSSLKSQMAPATDAGGNKPVEAALPSIQPVDLTEAVARSLILQQVDPGYPENAKGQRGVVVLQLLIGPDGAVQDTKFQQGSLVFARAATEAVKQWRFKPYTLNTHPVSVRTVLTLSFKPTS